MRNLLYPSADDTVSGKVRTKQHPLTRMRGVNAALIGKLVRVKVRACRCGWVRWRVASSQDALCMRKLTCGLLHTTDQENVARQRLPAPTCPRPPPYCTAPPSRASSRTSQTSSRWPA